MAHYTFRFLNPTGGVIRMAFAERDTDGEAVRTALADAREPYALLEVWRGALVYRGTGAEYALAPSKVEQYRNKAKELRSIAEDWTGKETCQMLLRLAADYDQLADNYSDAGGVTP